MTGLAPTTPLGALEVTSIMDTTDEKKAPSIVEDIHIQNEQHALSTMPESIRHMSEEERNHAITKMKRKIDMVIPPIVMLLYILNYIDRQNLAAAKLAGVLTDLHMDSVQFATAISILFCTYLPFQILSNMIIARITRPGLYICCAVAGWGLVSGCTALVQTYGALLGVRLLLGLTESVFFVGAIYLMSAWYTRTELGKRLAFFYMGQQLGNGFGGLIAAGVLKLDGVRGIAGWRWLFIVEGAATVGIAIICAFILPEFPHNARLLTPLERDLAVWRLQAEAGAGEGQEDISTKQGFIMAVKDIKLWCIVVMNILAQGMGSVTNFFPTIVSALGYNTTITLLLTAPPYIFTCFFFYGITWYSDRYNQIYIPMMICMAISVVAYIISLSTLSLGARYFAVMLLPSGSVTPQLLFYKTLMIQVSRPYRKRAAAGGILNAVAGTSNIWGSYLWLNPPHFYDGFGPLLGFALTLSVLSTMYRWYCQKLNARLDRGEMIHGVTKEQAEMGWRLVGW